MTKFFETQLTPGGYQTLIQPQVRNWFATFELAGGFALANFVDYPGNFFDPKVAATILTFDGIRNAVTAYSDSWSQYRSRKILAAQAQQCEPELIDPSAPYDWASASGFVYDWKIAGVFAEQMQENDSAQSRQSI